MSLFSQENPIKIIIADDHEVVRSGLKRLLKFEEDFKIIGIGADGIEAVELVEYHKPDVLLIDVYMPRMNGIEAVKEIRKKKIDVFCIILTAFEDANHINNAISAGADGYLSKDVSAKDLVNSIRTVVEGERVFSKSIIQLMQGRLSLNNASPVALTKREQEILNFVALGKKNIEIAKELSISCRTVENHRYHIIKKLDIKNSADLVRFAVLNAI